MAYFDVNDRHPILGIANSQQPLCNRCWMMARYSARFNTVKAPVVRRQQTVSQVKPAAAN